MIAGTNLSTARADSADYWWKETTAMEPGLVVTG